LQEWKNIVKVEAWDNAQDPYDWVGLYWYWNYSVKSTYVLVDNSRSSYWIQGDKSYKVLQVDSKMSPSDVFDDNTWKNKTLNLVYKVPDKLWENWWLKPEVKYCSWKPANSIRYLPAWVDPNTWKFTTYCDSSWKCNPDVWDCKWKCKPGYVEDNWKCVLEKKQFSCKEYFENKGYNLSNVDGNKLYFGLKWYWTEWIDKKTGIFVAVYDTTTHSYKPTLNDCLLIPDQVTYTMTENIWGKETKVTWTTDGLIIVVGNIVKVISSIVEESCWNLSQLTDFVWAGDTWVAWW